MVLTIASAGGGHQKQFTRVALHLSGTILGAGILTIGSLGFALLVPAPETQYGVPLALALMTTVALSEAGLFQPPGLHRQVNRYDLHRYGADAASFYWGFQLGLGLTTRVSSWGLYALLVVPWLSGNAWLAPAGLLLYGMGRGLQPLTALRLGTPADLVPRLDAAGLRSTISVSLVAAMALTLTLNMVA